MDKDLIALGKKYNELELAVEFAGQNKTIAEFQEALLEKKLSKGSDVDAGEKKELSGFSFAKFMEEKIEQTNGKMTGFAKEISQGFLNNGYKGHGGIILPRSLVEEMRIKQVRAAGANLFGVALAGGNTATNDYRAQVIDALYNSSVWNMLSTQMPSASGYGSITYPLVTSKNNVQMLGELVAASVSRNEFDGVNFTPKTAKVTAKVTRELMKTSSLQSIESFVMNAAMKAMAEKRNQQWLHGTGTAGEVLGIFNVAGTNAISNGANGGVLTYAKVVEFESAVNVANANSQRAGYVTNSKVAGSLKTTQKFASFGEGILTGGVANGYPIYTSNEVLSNFVKGTGVGLSAMAFVNPEYVHVIEWEGVEFNVNPFIEGDGAIRIEGFDTFDMQVSRAIALAVSKDIVA